MASDKLFEEVTPAAEAEAAKKRAGSAGTAGGDASKNGTGHGANGTAESNSGEDAAAGSKPKRPKSKSGGADWTARLQKDKQGQRLGNLANMMMGFRSDPAWLGVLTYDEMKCCAVMQRPLPEVGKTPPTVDAILDVPLKDTDVSKVQEWFQLSGIPRVSKETTHQAVDLHACQNSRHPLREWLEGLAWDGDDRLDSWMTRYLGAREIVGPDGMPTGYVGQIGAMFLISMVARILKPGCKVDHMLVLEGPQGALKSTACKILSGPDYFSDNMPEDVESKDAALHLRGKWLIELAEMGHLSRSQTTTLKSFLTRQVDIYRPSYGRLEVHQLRQCVFIGSTNDDEYLKDETGGRRFWPVKCGEIDTAALERNRDQLFAEAVFSFREGRAWWPDADFERRFIRPQQAERYQADPWEESVRGYIAGMTSVTVNAIASGALGLDIAKIGRADQNRITAILQTAGWVRGRHSGHQRPWVPGPAA